MADGGKLPAEKFTTTATPTENGQVLNVKPTKATFGEKKPEFESVTLTVVNVQKVTVQRVNNDGEKVGQPETQDVKKPDETSEQTVTVVFPTSQTSDGFVVTIVNYSAGKPSSVTVISVVACLPDEGW